MTGQRSASDSGSLYREIWRIERQIKNDKSPWHRVGEDGWPDKELVKFRARQHQGFAGQDVVRARHQRTEDGKLRAVLDLDFMSLTGARGVLPGHYSELVLQQLKAKSPALQDFLDLFNHRLLSLFYRSWARTQPAVAQERDELDPFTAIMRALTGVEDDSQLQYGAALMRGPKSGAVLCQILEDLTGIKVRYQALQGGWVGVDIAEQSAMPSKQKPMGQFAHLGEAVLGSKTWVADKGLVLNFAPKSHQQVASLLPGGQYSGAVADLNLAFAGRQTRVRCQMTTQARFLPGARANAKSRLGADSFLQAINQPDSIVTVGFTPRKG
ncbi:type VI secretion system baseplate subunit TssG [Gallaecimonas mangrovi]|uniref:type VI secretion system baseplate subunit TssG n=1 Tax=Gallaecimonas mangrovi TaxID=2291597 RepID=UPI000E20C671|nr:type VI secretion system baseplate subunit TssG [Gallaecimonas mangrovi]